MLTDPFSRRSGDHGAFNQWDRLPYLSFEHDGINPSVKQAQNQLHHNTVVSNYVADAGCFDHDDGASFADMSNNFCVGGGHKNNVSSPFPQPKQHLRFRSLHSNAVAVKRVGVRRRCIACCRTAVTVVRPRLRDSWP